MRPRCPRSRSSSGSSRLPRRRLGETGGDTVTMTHAIGAYLAGTDCLFFAVLVALVVFQIIAKKFHPILYWATIVASTTFGTTMADFADRSLGIGYTGGSSSSLSAPDGDARPMVLVAWLHLGRDGEYPESGSVLLGGDHLFADLGHRARRLDGRFHRPRLRRWGACVRCGHRRRRGPVLLDQRLPCAAVLGGVHPHPSAWRDGRRFPR